MHRAQRAATDIWGPHPRWYLFLRDVQQRRWWQHPPLSLARARALSLSLSKVTDLCCRLFLPTLLHGPEAAHLADLVRLWVRTGVRVSLSSSFSGTREARRTSCKRQGALPTTEPYLKQSAFRVRDGYEEPPTLLHGVLLACVTAAARMDKTYPYLLLLQRDTHRTKNGNFKN